MNRNNKKLWLIGGIVAVLLLGYFVIAPGVLYLLSWNPTLEGAGGSSDDISESKRRGVFLWEYKPEKNPIRIRDGEYLDIVEIWAERSWAYPEFSRGTELRPKHFQIVIRARPEGLTHYYYNNFDGEEKSSSRHWTIGVNNRRVFYTRESGKLVHEQYQQPPDSCEVFPIQQGHDLSGRIQPVIIEQLRLCRQD